MHARAFDFAYYAREQTVITRDLIFFCISNDFITNFYQIDDILKTDNDNDSALFNSHVGNTRIHVAAH